MFRCPCVCLLLAGLAYGQAAAPATGAQSQKPNPPAVTASTSPDTSPARVELPPDTPVITIQGSCAASPADKNTSECKTVVTRAEFESLLKVFAPHVPPAGQSRIATSYGEMLVVANEARKRGLDQTPEFQAKIAVSRLQLLAKELDSQLQAESAEIPQKDLENYYQEHIANFQEADLQRIAIPLRKQMDTSKEKLSDEEMKKREQDAQDAMKKEAEAIRARAAAGEDFDKLQAEVYTFAGFKISAPSTKMMKVRRSALPNDQASVFDLKSGETSPLLTTPTGYSIYKVGAKETIPLDEAKVEIQQVLGRERFQELRQGVLQSGKPVLNAAYFGQPPSANPAQRQPGSSAAPAPPSPGPK